MTSSSLTHNLQNMILFLLIQIPVCDLKHSTVTHAAVGYWSFFGGRKKIGYCLLRHVKRRKGEKKDLGPFIFFFLSVLVNLAVRGLK